MREEDNTAGLASPVAFEPHPQGSRGSSSAAGRGSSGDGLDGNGADAVPAMGTTLAAALAGQPLKLVETDFLAWSLHHLGVDIELLVYRALRAFRCAPFYQHSTRMRIRLGDPPPPQLDRSGLHPANPGE